LTAAAKTALKATGSAGGRVAKSFTGAVLSSNSSTGRAGGFDDQRHNFQRPKSSKSRYPLAADPYNP
jgi:hypothetical protein